ncbi:MAG: hypothetical protein MI861_18385, partial [Pirellulales bacterium]|nr:hypothetical protein [Pirellulales bacterium]
MNSTTLPNRLNAFVPLTRLRLLALLVLAGIAIPCQGQQEAAQAQSEQVQSEQAQSEKSVAGGTIIIQTQGPPPKPPVFYTANANASVQIRPQSIEQTIQLAVNVIQGEAKTLSFGLSGEGNVTELQAPNILSWAIRQVGSERFIDLHLKEGATELKPVIKIRSDLAKLPLVVDLAHLTPGKSVGFDSIVNIEYAEGVEGTVTVATGFAPLLADRRTNRFQSSTGGRITLSLSRDGASPGPVELIDSTLSGELHPNGKSVTFQFRSTAQVTEADAEITLLSGGAAVSQVPVNDNYRLRLASDNGTPVYKLVFSQAGTFPVTLDFVATLAARRTDWHSMDFTIAASAIVPLTLKGLDSDLEFHRDEQAVVPQRVDDAWLGFLPASGRARLQWKTARQAGEGKLFFTTTGRVEAKVGAGLLRQDHQIDYQVLQGELTSLSLLLYGPGEILDVQGNHLVAWKVTDKDDHRQLDATLSQPITATGQIRIRSQTPLDAFPVRVEGLRLNPVGAIRHSGFLRLSNLGSVRLEPVGLSGLTQLAPEQFPGEAIESRQVFVYRFPAADHSFTVAADRIQPEVNLSELVLYQLAETDRVIHAEIEMDIREAPIRQWDFGIPADYSVVSVTGANVADYVVGSQVADGRRNLKVIFTEDISGRHLVTLYLEKNEAAAEGPWVLPRIEHPQAKTVRGNIGVIGAPGFRIGVAATDLLVEKPLSYFPKPTANLQQAFRIRQSGWSATMQIELLQRSVQSDVFHLYSLSQETVYGSALINYFVTGAPISEWRITVPATLGNVMV